MDDEKLDEFIAHGYGMEFDMNEPSAPAPPVLAAVIDEAEAIEETVVSDSPGEVPTITDEPDVEPPVRASRSTRSRRRSSDEDGPSSD